MTHTRTWFTPEPQSISLWVYITGMIKAPLITFGPVCGVVVGQLKALCASRPGKHPSCYRQDCVVAGGCRKKLQWVTYLGYFRKQHWRRGDAALLQPICARSRARGRGWQSVLLICKGDANSGWQGTVRDRSYGRGNQTRHIFYNRYIFFLVKSINVLIIFLKNKETCFVVFQSY